MSKSKTVTAQHKSSAFNLAYSRAFSVQCGKKTAKAKAKRKERVG